MGRDLNTYVVDNWLIRNFTTIQRSGGSRIFPTGCTNSQKLHENERIWTPGGLASLAPPLDPPMQRSSESGEWKWFRMNGKLLFKQRCLYYGNGLKGDLVVNVVNAIENDINNIINEINDNNDWNLSRIPQIMSSSVVLFVVKDKEQFCDKPIWLTSSKWNNIFIWSSCRERTHFWLVRK